MFDEIGDVAHYLTIPYATETAFIWIELLDPVNLFLGGSKRCDLGNSFCYAEPRGDPEAKLVLAMTAVRHTAVVDLAAVMPLFSSPSSIQKRKVPHDYVGLLPTNGTLQHLAK